MVTVRAWRYDMEGRSGHIVPIYLLDTDLEENSGWDRGLTDHLYGGDTNYRLQQEIVLGMGGVRMANALGLRVNVYHMNEGHAALLTLALLEASSAADRWARHRVRHRAGAAASASSPPTRRFPPATTASPPSRSIRILGGERTARLEKLGCFHEGMLNMTLLALRFSRYANGVAMQHGKVSREMFPEFAIDSITNGVHAPHLGLGAGAADARRAHSRLAARQSLPAQRHRPARAGDSAAHARAKEDLLAEVASRTGLVLNPKVLTLGFARRAATYKRADLLFTDPERLLEIAAQPAACRFSMPARRIHRMSRARLSSSSVIENAPKISNDHPAHRLSRKLRLGSGRNAHLRRGCLGQYAAAAL